MTIDIKALAEDYKTDRRAVRKWAEREGISIQGVYWHMDRAGIKRRSGCDANKGTQAAENNPNWKNGTTMRKDGYILERRDGKQLAQHRIVAEKKIGRQLRDGEVVHHIDGDRSNNSPENLEVLPSHAEHMKKHCDSEAMRARGRKGNEARWAALKARVEVW